MEQAGIFSVFDKSSSIDRLFPNQNFHSGKRLGNLIALPLHKPTLEEGNSCFIDEQLKPFQSQWKFLSTIQKVTVSYLDAIYNALLPDNVSASLSINSKRLQIHLCNVVRLNRSGMTPKMINFLKKELNFANSEYYIKKKSGRNTWGTQR